MLECKSVTKSFGSFKALDDVSITVPQGKIFGLLGPNGAGKTTLIRIINRITIPTSGEIFYQGKRVTDEMVRTIGYLPEERGLFKKMKVGEQCLYLARLRGMSTSDATAELKKWFIRFGIQSWWPKKVEELSKGMAQKVQFITTVIHKPGLLILDEPFSGFDPVNAKVIRDEILRLKDEGTTIILSTHNMESVEELCDNIALINKSRLVVTGGTEEIRRKWGSNCVEVLYRSTEPLSASTASSGDGSVTEPVSVSSASSGDDVSSGNDVSSSDASSVGAVYAVRSDELQKGCRRAVLELRDGCSSKEVLGDLIGKVDIISYRELMPRMNDIFIKLVTGRQ